MLTQFQIGDRENSVQRLKDVLPWYAKIAAKIVLSRLPIPYDFWRRTSLFRHGAMDVPQRAFDAVNSIARAAGYDNGLDGLTVLELGPGDSLATALIAYAAGAKRTILVDAGAFATRDMKPYHALADLLIEANASMQAIRAASDPEQMLSATNAQYLTGGLASMRTIRAGSIDFAFSKAVLEHIRASEFRAMMEALRTAMAPTGRCYHFVDLQDHLAYALNNLRFSDRLWESDLMAKSGFYTNRIGYEEMISIFRDVGFAVESLTVERFARVPTPKARMAARFQTRSDEDLLVSGFSVLLRPV